MNIIIICAVLILSVFQLFTIAEADDFDDPNFPFGPSTNLGENINNYVKSQIDRANAQIKNTLNTVKNNNNRFAQENQYWNENLNLNSGIDGLDTFGERINAQVQQSLQPVYALQITVEMSLGTGGITIAKYGDNPEKYIIINGKKYTCPGEIVKNENDYGVKCTETLKPLSSDNPCIGGTYGYSKYNNIYCFGAHTEFNCVNNNCQCIGGQLLTYEQLQQKCGTNFDTDTYAKYEYFPNPRDSNRVKLPNSNPYVRCENSDLNDRCVFYGPQINYGFHSSSISHGNNIVRVNNHAAGTSSNL